MAKIINKTTEIIGVYYSKSDGTYETSLYSLPSGCETPDGWDADGIFIPNDRVAEQFVGADVLGSAAIKFAGSSERTITQEGNKYKCPPNQGAFASSESRCPSDTLIPGLPRWVCWSIPTINQAKVVNFPKVPGMVCNNLFSSEKGNMELDC